MRFKVGDRIILTDSRWTHRYTTGSVCRPPEKRGSKWYLPVRFDGVEYGTETNCHSGWTIDEFELEVVINSPLYKALS